MHKQSIILDYNIGIRTLRDQDKIFLAGALGNYSLAGFEMVSKTNIWWENERVYKEIVLYRV